MTKTMSCPKTTGLSPKEGPPGTKITIRGENLGLSQDDLISVHICGVDCIMYSEWLSPQKIISRSGRCKGLGDVIVTTKSGGIGSSTVQFKGYEEIVGPTKDSAVWIDENDFHQMNVRHRSTSPTMMFSNDPLGLCTDEDSPSKTRSAKINDSLFRELFPEATEALPQTYANITSDHFLPNWYLLEHHNNTSFNDLKLGLELLRAKCETQMTPNASSAPVTFLKSNVLPVIECLDALKALHLALKKDKQEVGPDLNAKVDELIRKSTEEAHAIFDAILSRKDKADSTRNALNVLQRYRFLFNLPSNIDKSILKGDYDIVINDFSRAKSLFSNSSVNVFKKVYSEVVQRIEKFRVMLNEKLRQSCSQNENRNIDEVKRLIRYLISLDQPGDPAWHSIETIKQTLLYSIDKCREKHKNSKTKTVAIEADDMSDNEDSVDYPVEAPQQIQFVDELTHLFNNFFPDLFKLGTVYLNGDLYAGETYEQLRAKDDIFYKEMVEKQIQILCDEMRAAVLPNSIKNMPHIQPWSYEIDEQFVLWLPYCLRSVITCYSNLSKLELSSNPNNNVLKPLNQLIFDLRVHSMICLFNQCSAEIKNLHLKEIWEMDLDDMVGARTQLPLLYECKVIEILQLVRETIIQVRSSDDTDIFSQINVQGSVKQLAQNLLQSFICALEKTVSTPQNSPSSTPKTIPLIEDRTLIVLCNCSFTYNQVIPRLHESFEKFGYPDMSLVIKITQNKFRDLENRLFDQYIERKCDVIIGAIEPAMYLFGNEWFSSNQMPSDVSYYIKEILTNLIEIQSEVYQIAPVFVEKVMYCIIESALEEIERLYDSISTKITDAARLQSIIDIGALRLAFSHSRRELTTLSDKKLNQCLTCLSTQDYDFNDNLVDKILNSFEQSMHLQLSCFRYEFEATLLTV
ncbi:exocyst complex component 2-like [Oppia nitens]|uniref:exocyst complex component 2-like n=1 Tax=Oppia nitens TaxID=1686743 RepID=UPI0023DBE920|nr:exocyst complex component 2-like [Oppia nitens]